jgi:hypothetical protein
MDEDVFSALISQLSGLKWFIFSGLAVKVYSNSDREIGDIDILVDEEDLEELARRLDTAIENRDMFKQGNHVDDRGFVTDFKGIEVEVSSGFPQKRLEQNNVEKLFDRSNQVAYLGEEIKLVPVEELVVHKAKMRRDKDLKDLKMLNDQEIDQNFLSEIINDWGIERSRIIPVLKAQGFKVEISEN